MKAFIFVALVACVAARNLDIDTLRLIKEKSLLTKPVVDDVLLKEKLIHQLPLEKKTVLGDVAETVYPLQDKTVLRNELTHGIYDEVDVDRVLAEYYDLPYFRAYLKYPAFQRYISSVYFKRFYQIPTFKTFFVNPFLFQKYILPFVELFQNEYTLPYNYIYGQDRDVYGQQDVYGQDLFGLQGLVRDVYRNRNAYPYVYNTRYGLPTSYITGEEEYYNTYGTHTNYKFLLDKIYKTLFRDQPFVGDVTQIKTDVKILPGGEKKFVVEPITGERKVIVEEPKIVDVKVDQKIVPVEKIETVVPVEKEFVGEITERDVLLLQVLLKEHIITPQQYNLVINKVVDLTTVLRQVYGEHVDIKDVVRQIINRDFPYTVVPVADEREVLLVKILLKEHVITPETYEAVIKGQIPLVTVLRHVFGRQVDVNDVIRQIVNRRDVFDNIYTTPTVYDRYNTERFDRFDVPTFDRYTYGKFDRYNTQKYDRFDIFNRFNKYNKYNTYYNTEIPTLRENTYERLPIQNVLEKIVA